MRIEWEEDKLYDDVNNKGKQKYTPNISDWLDYKQMVDEPLDESTFEEFKEEFKNTDLSQFDDVNGRSEDN